MDPTAPTDLDALVVLGCPMRPGGIPGAAAERRAERAARAYRSTGARLVVASGGRRWYGSAEADVLRARLVSLGVPAGIIVRELCSLSTIENAAYSAEILRAMGLSQAGIVTCDWHLPRALACFEWMGIHGTPFSAESPPRATALTWIRKVRERARKVADRRAALEWAEP